MLEPKGRLDRLLVIADDHDVLSDRLEPVADDAPEEADPDALIATLETRERLDDARGQQDRPRSYPNPTPCLLFSQVHAKSLLADPDRGQSGRSVVGFRFVGSGDRQEECATTTAGSPQTGHIAVSKAYTVIHRLPLTEQPQVGGGHTIRKAEVVPRDLRPLRATRVVVHDHARAPKPAELDRRGEPGRTAADDDTIDRLDPCPDGRRGATCPVLASQIHIAVREGRHSLSAKRPVANVTRSVPLGTLSLLA
jgi:hypothetical protein